MSPISKPTLRWGIIATGQISSSFVRDLVLSRHDARTTHIIQAIGSSSQTKGNRFVQEFIPDVVPQPRVYGSYGEVYADPDVDVVYISTPHAFHKQNCLDAILAGKHVLCEKAFTITAQEARDVFAAASKRGVFVMEAMWTRFFPLTRTLVRLVHEEKAIGHVHRVFCDLGLDMDLAGLGSESRLKNPALGAGTLLDLCIYSLNWGLLTLDAGIGKEAQKPDILAKQTLSDSIDIATSVLLSYPATGAQGILTSTSLSRTPRTFCRIEGTEGFIVVEGISASGPTAFTIHPKMPESGVPLPGRRYEFEHPGSGLYWEADAIALDIAAGRLENEIMPWAETLRIMEIMDEIRGQGGARFPQDDTSSYPQTNAMNRGS